MKPEPLTKEKIIGIDDVDEEGKAIERIVVELENVKSAVDLVLKEIEKEIKEAEEETIRFKEYRNIRMFDFWDGKKEGLIEAKSLIKKAFEGVIE